jgi:ribosomal-protein-alanine N-acetyltransferase
MSDTKIFDFSSFPVLTTERLTLRKLLMADAEDVLVFRGDAYVQRYNSVPITTIREAEEQIIDAHAEYGRHEGIPWAVTYTGSDTVLGSFGLHNWSHNHRRAEAGYDLARAYWGQGIATEALRAILHFGFTEMSLHRIYAGTIADNHESVRLLERLGFTREGTRRESSWEEDGTFHDSAIYGLLLQEFFSEQSIVY